MFRRRLFVVVGLLVVPLALASCGYPIAGGLLGALLLVGALLAGGLTLASVPGCGPCLSPPVDLGPAGRDLKVTPCLGLGRDGGDDGKIDARVGPCLGRDLKLRDAGVPRASLELPAGPDRIASIDRLEADGVLTPELAARLRRLG